jgi:very-short-patch-repair endonuclease
MKKPFHYEADGHIFENAKSLRKVMTPAEEVLWKALRNRRLNNLKFRRQQPVKYYVPDFYCHEKRLAIEVDGRIHDKADHKLYDTDRTFILNDLGITVIRFRNEMILENIDEVLNKIKIIAEKLTHPHTPSPTGEDAGG